MLEDLDSVAWDRLQHAYGTAEDVPGLLRELVQGDAAATRTAMTTLWGTVWHQGSVYEASAPTVPFLAEIAAGGEAVSEYVRAAVVLLLMDIARGHAYLDFSAPDPDLSEQLQAQQQRELEWADAARRAVGEHLGVVRSLLDSDSAAIRAAAAGVAAQFPEQASSWSERVEQLRATSSGPAAGLYELVGVLLAGQPVSDELLDRVAATDEGTHDYLPTLRELELPPGQQAADLAALLAERSVGLALG